MAKWQEVHKWPHKQQLNGAKPVRHCHKLLKIVQTWQQKHIPKNAKKPRRVRKGPGTVQIEKSEEQSEVSVPRQKTSSTVCQKAFATLDLNFRQFQ